MAWVLYLTNGRQVLYRVNRRGAKPVWEGEGSPPAEKPDSWSLSRVAVLVDLMEEEYRIERLPHLTGSDRRALWNRKRRQLFRNEPLVSAMVIGHEKDGRRDDLVLFTVLRQNGVFSDWVDALSAWRVTVTGIWSLPRLSARWRNHSLADGMRLLIYPCAGRVALRQNFHRQGRLVFSRLSFVEEEAMETEGAQELERTWRYLGRLLGLDPGQGVDLQVWAPSFWLRRIQGLWEALPYFRPRCLDLGKIACGQGWKEDVGQVELPAYAAWKFIRITLPRSSHYHDPALSRLEKQSWLNFCLYTGTVALLAGAAAYGAVMERHMVQVNEEIRRLRLQKREMLRLVENLPQPEEVAELDPRELETLMDLKRTVERGMIDPGPMMELVSSALGRFPRFHLNAIAWDRVSGDEGDAETDDPERLFEQPISMTFTVKAALLPGKLRYLVDQVENLVSWLEDQPHVVSARISESSIPLKDDEPVKGEFGGLEKMDKSAIFTLEIEYVLSGGMP